MVRRLSAACGTLALSKCERRSGRLEYALSERWMKSVRTEYLDHLFISSKDPLPRSVSSSVTDFNSTVGARSRGQRASSDSTIFQIRAWAANCKIIANRYAADCITWPSVSGRIFGFADVNVSAADRCRGYAHQRIGVLPAEWVSPAGRFVPARQTPLL